VRLLPGSQATGNVTVLLGPGYRGEAAEIASDDPRFTVVCNAENVAALFARADLAVCGAGGTCLELASLGVPMVLLELSDDQRRIAQHVARAGAAVNLGDWRTTGDRQILEGLRQLTHSPAGKQRMATAGRGLVDGKGAVRTGRMIDELWRSLPAASLAGNALR
jgi:spore coat polysaccharide biosynthesis predicted glycosyltransferase SpsG